MDRNSRITLLIAMLVLLLVGLALLGVSQGKGSLGLAGTLISGCGVLGAMIEAVSALNRRDRVRG